MVRKVGGRTRNDLTSDAVIRSMAIASGLGDTSAYSWLKIPVVDEMERVTEASTLQLPGVRGLVAGRNLLYPPGDDVAAAVDTAVSLLGNGPT